MPLCKTTALVLLVGIGPALARQQGTGIQPFVGTWRVLEVHVAPAPVQAVRADDPDLIGAVLDVSPDRLSWREPHTTSSLSVVCDHPRLTGSTITCRQGDFGPPDAKATRAGKLLSLQWFDGVTLLLTRVR